MPSSSSFLVLDDDTSSANPLDLIPWHWWLIALGLLVYNILRIALKPNYRA